MTIRRGLHVADAEGVGPDAVEGRLALAGLFSAAGVLTGGTVSGTAGWQYSVTAFVVTSQRAESDGHVIFANDAAVLVDTAAAPATGTRWDIIYALHHDVDNADPDSLPVIEVASGDASGTPVPPSIPTGAVELGRAEVGASATNTAHADVTYDHSNRPAASLRGGIATVNSEAQRDALLAATDYRPLFAWLNGELLANDGSGWVTIHGADTDWQSGGETYASNWSAGSVTPQYRRQGNRVWLRGRIERSSTIPESTSYELTARIPTGFRPVDFTYGFPLTGGFGAHFQGNIAPDGQIHIRMSSAPAAAGSNPASIDLDNITFLVD